MASQALAVAEGGHRRVPPIRDARPAVASRNATRRGQSGQSRGASASGTGLSSMHRERLGGGAMARTSYAIALGSNRRSRHGSPADDAARGARGAGGVGGVSAIRATPALGPAGRGFANAVAIVESELMPDAAARRAEGDRARLRPPRRAGAGARACSISTSSCGRAAPGAAPARSSPTRNFARRAFVLAAAGRARARLARPADRRHDAPAPRPVDRAPPRS